MILLQSRVSLFVERAHYLFRDPTMLYRTRLDETLLRYDQLTNTFGSFTVEGVPKTIFNLEYQNHYLQGIQLHWSTFMDNNKSKYYCRVCGLFQGEDHPPWGEDGHCPSFDICECCGVEFGYGDCFPEDVKKTRKEWLVKGASWDDLKYKPKKLVFRRAVEKYSSSI